MINEISDIRQLDSSLFKAFMAAARELNFTTAAVKAAMTQSGVSQQIAKLEEQVGAPLFERVNKKVHLTPAGRLLAELVEQHFDQTEKFLEQVSLQTRELRGPVRYAMPHSCLFTPHFPVVLQKRNKNFPGVTIDVQLCPNEDVVDLLLERKVDFGFITRKSKNPAVRHQVFAREHYVLIGPKACEVSAKSLVELPFVIHPGFADLFEYWRRHHLPAARKLSGESLPVAGRINSLHAALTMVSEGVGYTVVPRHCASDLKKIWIYENPAKTEPDNEIYIATLFGVRPSQRVQTVLNTFWDMK